MQTLEIRPLVGAGHVLLGASRGDVLNSMGSPQESYKKSPTSAHPTDLWFDGQLQVFYAGDEPRVEFIELSTGGWIEPVVYGIGALSRPATEVVAQLEQHAAFDSSDPELGCSYTFPTLELSLWRPNMEPPDGLTFQTIGIGVRGYYSDDA